VLWLTVTCYTGRVSILVNTSAGDARHRAAAVAALGGLDLRLSAAR
jgi:hypothetical protein